MALTKTVYKNIADAAPILRPHDVITKVLSNKFAMMDLQNTNGTFSKNHLMGLHDGKIYGYPSQYLRKQLELPNVEPMVWCYDHSEHNGIKYLYHYLRKHHDHRKWKHDIRQILKLLPNAY